MFLYCLIAFFDISIVLLIVYTLWTNLRKGGQYKLSRVLGRKNYARLKKVCKTDDCSRCPFHHCFYAGCEEVKREVLKNNSNVSIYLKEEYKRGLHADS